MNIEANFRKVTVDNASTFSKMSEITQKKFWFLQLLC